MVGQSLILLLIALERLFLTASYATRECFGRAVTLVHSLQHKEILAVTYILRIDNVRKTLAEREIVDGIQQVTLAHTVVPDKTVDIIGKVKVGLNNILEVKYR